MKTITAKSFEVKRIRHADQQVVVKVWNADQQEWVAIWSMAKSEPFIVKVEVGEVESLE